MLEHRGDNLHCTHCGRVYDAELDKTLTDCPSDDCPVHDGSFNFIDSTHARYEIYVANATDLGWSVKTFDEWLDS